MESRGQIRDDRLLMYTRLVEVPPCAQSRVLCPDDVLVIHHKFASFFAAEDRPRVSEAPGSILLLFPFTDNLKEIAAMAAWLAYISTIADRLTKLRDDAALWVVLKCWECFSRVDDRETPTRPWTGIDETDLVAISGPTEALRIHLQFLLPSETITVIFHYIRGVLMGIVDGIFRKQMNGYEPEHWLSIRGKVVGLEVYMAILGIEIDDEASSESEYLVNYLQTLVGVGISLQKDLTHLPQELKRGGTTNFIILTHLRERGRKLINRETNVHDLVKAILDTVKNHNQLQGWAFECYERVRKKGCRKDILQARTLYHLLGAHWRWRCEIEGYEQR